MFEAKRIKDECVAWIRQFFAENGPDCNAVVGISGGKDSSVVAALCVEALGRDRVIGVLMPCGEQADIDCSRKLVDHLGIRHYTVNVQAAVEGLKAAMPADLPLSEVQTVTVDLTACDYSGELWLSIGHPTRKMCYLREIRFYEGEIPADTEEPVDTAPDTPAEAPDPEVTDTAEPTYPEETAPTDTRAPETGCTAALPAVFFVSLALSSAALLPRRHRRPRRG